jgi:hypothetical protein
MLRLKDVMEPMLKRMELYQAAKEHEAMLVWPHVVGPHVARNTAPVAVKGGVLFVRTASSSWMHELAQGFRSRYVEQLNARLGKAVVSDIRFLPGPLPQEVNGDINGTPPALALPSLTPDEEAMVASICHEVADDSNRDVMARVMRRSLALQRARQEAGWTACPTCDELTPDGKMCITCHLGKDSERRKEIRDMLTRAPWSSALEVKARFRNMTQKEYEFEKRLLMARLRKRISDWHGRAPYGEPFPSELRQDALRYCMLRSGKSPSLLRDEDIQYSLGGMARRLR